MSIGNSVTSIGEGSFVGCNNLQYNEYDNAKYLGNDSNPYVVLIKANSSDIISCNIHSNTKFIYNNAFYDYMLLMNIEIPNSVISI